MVDVRRRRDDEIDGTTARLAATPNQSRREPTPFARDAGVNGERIEGRLDDPEPQRSPCSLVVRRSDQHAEVQLRKRRSADRALQFTRALGADQNRRIEEDTHLREGIDESAGETGQVVFKRLRRRRQPYPLQILTTDPLTWSRRAKPSDRPTRHRDSELFACLGSPEYLTDVVAELLLLDRHHAHMVAVLLPAVERRLACPGEPPEAHRLTASDQAAGISTNVVPTAVGSGIGSPA